MIDETRNMPKYFVSNRLNDAKVRFYDDTAIAQGSETWEKHSGEPGRSSGPIPGCSATAAGKSSPPNI